MIITIHNIYVCMYECIINSVDIYLLCMIKFMLRWCICSMWRMLFPCGKLIGLLLFCLHLLSILFLKPHVHTYKKFQGMSSLAQ